MTLAAGHHIILIRSMWCRNCRLVLGIWLHGVLELGRKLVSQLGFHLVPAWE